MRKPARMLHLPHGPADGEHVQVAGFQEPDDAVFGIPFRELRGPVIPGAGEVHQAVRTAADEAALKTDLSLFVLLRAEGLQDHRFRGIVGNQRILFRFEALLFPPVIAVHGKLLSPQQVKRVPYALMPGLHAEGSRAGTVDGRRIAEGGKQEGQVGVVGIAHEPLGAFPSDPFKIHMIQDLAHQLSAPAGDQHIAVL